MISQETYGTLGHCGTLYYQTGDYQKCYFLHLKIFMDYLEGQMESVIRAPVQARAFTSQLYFMNK